MRRHPELFSEWKKTEDPSSPAKEKKPVVTKSKDGQAEVQYDPGNLESDQPPKPPTNLIPFAKGYRFTTADDQFIISESYSLRAFRMDPLLLIGNLGYFTWFHKKTPGAGKSEILRSLSIWVRGLVQVRFEVITHSL